MKLLNKLACATALSCSALVAQADIIKYTFDATYGDSSELQGEFFYDTSNGDFSHALIVNSGGSTYGPNKFSEIIFEAKLGDREAIVLVDPADGPDYTGDTVLNIVANEFGGLNPTLRFTDLGTCSREDCPGRGNIVNATDVSLTGEVVPSLPQPDQGIEINGNTATLFFKDQGWTASWNFLCVNDNCVAGILNNGRWERDISGLDIQEGQSYDVQIKIEDTGSQFGQYISDFITVTSIVVNP